MEFNSIRFFFKDCKRFNFNNFNVTGINYDYRKVKLGNIYFAINIFNYKGKERNGHEFVKEAVYRGARAVILKEYHPGIDKSVCQIVCGNPRELLEKVSAFFYRYPAKKLYTIGVTGTKGKTTTVYLISHFLESAGIKTGFFSTADFKIGEKVIPNFTDKLNETHLSCPEALEVQKYLSRMIKVGTKVVVVEATSHALKLNRAAQECHYDIGVLTNLQSDHLDFHKTLSDYYSSKGILFNLLSTSVNKGMEKCAVFNVDDFNSFLIRNKTKCKIFTYGVNSKADIRPSTIEFSCSGIKFKIGKISFTSTLIGKHNLYNICAAIAAVRPFGLKFNQMRAGLKSFSGVPGRMEEIKNNKGIRIFIDYAHTPESLKECLLTLRNFFPKRIVVIFGCAGGRDKTKRPLMGETATRLADLAIITSEDSREEDPKKIAIEITKRLKKRNFYIELNRDKAIHKAIKCALPGDLIVITGKGDEKYMEIKGKQIPWSDKKAVLYSLKN